MHVRSCCFASVKPIVFFFDVLVDFLPSSSLDLLKSLVVTEKKITEQGGTHLLKSDYSCYPSVLFSDLNLPSTKRKIT